LECSLSGQAHRDFALLENRGVPPLNVKVVANLNEFKSHTIAVMFFSLKLSEELGDTQQSVRTRSSHRTEVTVVEGRIINATQHHVLYNSVCFQGDSGGALLIDTDRTGNYCVFGVHTMSTNAARELAIQNDSAEEVLNNISASVASLVRNSAEAYIGVRIVPDMLL